MPKSDQVILQALSKLESKIDHLDGRLDSVEKVLVKQEANIEHHVKRTDLAEENMKLFRQEMVPVKRHVDYMNGALKLIGVVGTLVALVAAAIQIVKFFL